MISTIFTYIFIGVACNFLFDILINYIQDEANRFTIWERVITTILWPIALIVFIYNFVKTLLGD
jgi:hypothetical protein